MRFAMMLAFLPFVLMCAAWRAAGCSLANARAVRDGRGPQPCTCGSHTIVQRIETQEQMKARSAWLN